MRNIIISIFILFYNAVVFSQNEKQVDSLFVVLKNQETHINQIDVLNKICLKYKENNISKLDINNQKILALAKKHNYQVGYGIYYLNCSRIYFSNDKYDVALGFAKKALSIFIKNKDITNYLIAVKEISLIYIRFDENEKIKPILNQNLKLALKHKNNDIIVDFYRLIGDNYALQDSIAKFIIYYKKVIPYLSKEKSFVKSIFFQKVSDQYTNLNQNEKAIAYIDLSIENREPNYQFLCEAKKALILNKISMHNQALGLSLENYESISKYNMTSEWQYNLILYNIANAYYNLKKYNLAMQYINKVIDVKNTIPEYKIECFVILSNIYFEKKEKKKARFYSQKAIVFHDSLYKRFGNAELYQNVSKIENDVGNYKQALYFYQKQVNLTTTKNAQINNENNLLLQTDFDVTLKDYNIKKLEEQKKIKTIENKKQKDFIIFIGILLLIALSSVIFYIKTYNTIKNKNKVIENEKLLTQKSLLEKEILLKEIHHRVKNNMQTVISLLKIQSLDAKELSVEDFISVSEARINSMVMVHENLYRNDDLSKVDFKEYLNNLTASIKNSYKGFKKIDLQIDINDIFLDVQTAIPIGLIVNELVNNAYKHAFKNKDKGKILIQISQKNEAYQLIVNDNGLGINDHQINNNGLGLELVRLLISQIKGVLEMDNSKGTSFKIKFENVIV